MRLSAALALTLISLAACSDVQAPALEQSDASASNRGFEHIPFITTAVATTEQHSCAIAMGAVRCWGRNVEGQLGDGTFGGAQEAGVVVKGPRLVQVSAGGFHSCGLDAAGAAYCWGDNSRGALGTGNRVSSAEPVAVATELRFASINAGNQFTCALAMDGTAHCWGTNSQRQLGYASTELCPVSATASVACSTTAAPVDGNHVFTTLDVSLWVGCGLTAGGTAICWGMNNNGQLGRGTFTGSAGQVPASVSGGHSWRTISVGSSHVCGIASDDLAYCWGQAAYGQLGYGGTTRSAIPLAVASGDVRFVSIAASGGNIIFGFVCATDAANAMYCWGANSQGQLGTSAPLPICNAAVIPHPCSTTPIAVVTDLRFEQFAAGLEAICAVATDKRGYCWGSNQFDVLGAPSVAVSTSTPTPIAATPGRGRGRQGPPPSVPASSETQ